jgi:DNA polymerase
MSAVAMRVELQSHLDRAGFYRALAQLLVQGINWDGVEWCVSPSPADPALPTEDTALRVLKRLPVGFRDTLHLALLHREPARHVLLHRMAQRLWREPRSWQDSLHDDHIRLMEWHRQVRRDIHKTKAFVRFNRVGDANQDAEQAEYVAWFEPVHHTLVEVAPFFVRRFTQMRWSILSPSAAVRWDGHRLQLGLGANRNDAPPPDAGEALWLAYYASIFNPARVKISAMKKEMPEIYWKNLPEARLIPTLLAQAPQRVSQMIASAADTQRRLPDFKLESQAIGPAVSLVGIATAVQSCDQCACAARATQAVMGTGPAKAKIFIVGEQPGDQEDLTGQPFVGPSGQLLRGALQAIGIDMADVYTTNAVKHFSYEMRGKRRIHKTPAQADVERCAQWLEAELQAVGPSTIVALGRTALRAIQRLAEFEPPTPPPHTMDRLSLSPTGHSERGRWRGAAVAAVAHPSALLRAGALPGTEGYLRWREDLRQVICVGSVQTDNADPDDSKAGCKQDTAPDDGSRTLAGPIIAPIHRILPTD